MPTVGNTEYCASEDFMIIISILDDCYLQLFPEHENQIAYPNEIAYVSAFYRGGLKDDGTPLATEWNIYMWNRNDTTDVDGAQRTAGTKETDPPIPGLPPIREATITPEIPKKGRPIITPDMRDAFANGDNKIGDIYIASTNPDETYWILSFEVGPFPRGAGDDTEAVENDLSTTQNEAAIERATRIHQRTVFSGTIELVGSNT